MEAFNALKKTQLSPTVGTDDIMNITMTEVPYEELNYDHITASIKHIIFYRSNFYYNFLKMWPKKL